MSIPAEQPTVAYEPPCIRELQADLLTPVGAYMRLRAHNRSSFLMESATGGETFGRFSILGCNPVRELTASAPGNANWANDPLSDSLSAKLGEFSQTTLHGLPGLPFSGGLVGIIGFDFVREIEKFSDQQLSSAPLAWLGDYRTFLVFDHLKQSLLLVGRTEDRGRAEADRELSDYEKLLCSDLRRHPPHFHAAERVSNFAKVDFCAAVESMKRHIVAGDIFQSVLSQKFSREFQGDAFELYRALRRINPSPYMFYLESPVGTAIGASPELLVGVESRVARLLPIAGTRPRGESNEADARLEKELLADPKERAEHMMLVDLARNDLGRVADYGSVRVDETAAIHRFSHVMHMVSRVSSKLKSDCSAVDALRASFPAGTVSGAPKVRALELIFEHEPAPRDFYAGACGFLGVDGNAEFCITLRTAFARDGVLTYQAGAGIVADSVPESEYQETLHKAGAIERAIQLAESA